MTQNETLSDRLAFGIIASISKAKLRPGDPLPTVRHLATQFDVTAPTIREALRRLQATGSVTMRHGSGIYVGPGIDRSLMPNPNGTPLTDARVLSLVEARLTIEPGIAALAAVNRTDADMENLRSAVDNATTDRSTVLTRNFHSDLAQASGNPMLYEVIDSLLHVHGTEQRRLRRMIENREREHLRHQEILDAISAQDPVAARDLTELHLRELLDEARARK